MNEWMDVMAIIDKTTERSRCGERVATIVILYDIMHGRCRVNVAIQDDTVASIDVVAVAVVMDQSMSM
jgi:hypothetical protein